MKRILIVEAKRDIQQLYETQLEGKFLLIKVFSLQAAHEMLDSHPNVDAIVLSSLVISENPPLLLPKITATFAGPIIGTSITEDLRNELSKQGCTHICERIDLAKELKKIFSS